MAILEKTKTGPTQKIQKGKFHCTLSLSLEKTKGFLSFAQARVAPRKSEFMHIHPYHDPLY